jgi:hypothetical protein
MSGRISWAAFVGAFAIFVASAWPGWMSIDSINMWVDATEGPIYDWHSPMLIWAWSHLGASDFGPLVPFLVQTTLSWAGLLLVAARLQRLGWRTSWLLFPGALFLDATWTVAWIWKDSLELSLLVAMVGLAASTDITRHRRWLWFSVSVLGAGLVATRWYLAPLGLGAIGALLCMAYPVSRRQVLRERKGSVTGRRHREDRPARTGPQKTKPEDPPSLSCQIRSRTPTLFPETLPGHMPARCPRECPVLFVSDRAEDRNRHSRGVQDEPALALLHSPDS